MAQINQYFKIVVCLLVLAQAVQSAPTEVETSTATPTTTIASTTTSAAPAPADSSSTTPLTPIETKDAAANTTDSVAVSSAQDQSHLNHTTFTCYGRKIGYYADVEADCKIYHFCILGDYNGEPVYQRISYLCLNETLFDQQALDCVSKLSAPCSDSSKYYEESNNLLRSAIIDKNTQSSMESS